MRIAECTVAESSASLRAAEAAIYLPQPLASGQSSRLVSASSLTSVKLDIESVIRAVMAASPARAVVVALSAPVMRLRTADSQVVAFLTGVQSSSTRTHPSYAPSTNHRRRRCLGAPHCRPRSCWCAPSSPLRACSRARTNPPPRRCTRMALPTRHIHARLPGSQPLLDGPLWRLRLDAGVAHRSHPFRPHPVRRSHHRFNSSRSWAPLHTCTSRSGPHWTRESRLRARRRRLPKISRPSSQFWICQARKRSDDALAPRHHRFLRNRGCVRRLRGCHVGAAARSCL
jgi:hypothetical protein